MKTLKTNQTAHINVDFTNDFTIEGAPLYVPGSEDIGPKIRKNIIRFTKEGIKKIFTQDWHAKGHISLASTHGVDPFTKVGKETVRPDHSMQDTKGAEFDNIIADLVEEQDVIQKGAGMNDLGYSGFDNTRLNDLLKSNDIKNLFVSGVATDYCVVATVLDALKLGYQVFVLADCIRGIGENIVTDNDEERIEDVRLQIEEAGGYIIDSDDIYFAKNNGDKDNLVVVKTWRKLDQSRANHGICA